MSETDCKICIRKKMCEDYKKLKIFRKELNSNNFRKVSLFGRYTMLEKFGVVLANYCNRFMKE